MLAEADHDTNVDPMLRAAKSRKKYKIKAIDDIAAMT